MAPRDRGDEEEGPREDRGIGPPMYRGVSAETLRPHCQVEKLLHLPKFTGNSEIQRMIADKTLREWICI